MTISPTKQSREAILAALTADPDVVALVPRLYPSKTPNKPTKPFGRYGSSDDRPLRPSGWRGGAVSAAYHVFVGVNSAILDPDSYCSDAVAAVAEALDRLPGCIVDRTQIIPDGEEPDTVHGLVFFTYTEFAEI